MCGSVAFGDACNYEKTGSVVGPVWYMGFDENAVGFRYDSVIICDTFAKSAIFRMILRCCLPCLFAFAGVMGCRSGL